MRRPIAPSQFRLAALLLCVAILPTATPAADSAAVPGGIDTVNQRIGSVPQYFFDSAVVEQVQDITRVWHCPEKQQGPLIKSDQPWEDVTYFSCNTWNVIYDSKAGEFKCWYEDWHADFPKIFRSGYKGFLVFGSYLPPYGSRLCFARSHDGIHWEKPVLDYLEEKGRKTNTVLGNETFGNVHSPFVFDDPFETNPDRRFKLMFDHQDGRGFNIRLAHSPDGIRWTMFDEKPAFGWMAGTKALEDVFIIAPDVESRTYRLTTRHINMQGPYQKPGRPHTASWFCPYMPNNPAARSKRRVFLSFSGDLMHWSLPQPLLATDDTADNLDDAFYGMAQMKVGDIWVGFVNTLHQVSNTMDVRLAFSRDGWNWHFGNQRQPWLRTTEGAWDCFMVNMPSVPVPHGNELLCYYGGSKNHHDWWINGLPEGLKAPEVDDHGAVGYALGLAKLRRDGFVSLDAGDVREGSIVTRQLLTEGGRLVLNARVRPSGYLDVEVTDANDQVLPGFARAVCERFTGDSLEHVVRWRGDSAKEVVPGGNPRLRFFMKDAELYSFAFQPSQPRETK